MATSKLVGRRQVLAATGMISAGAFTTSVATAAAQITKPAGGNAHRSTTIKGIAMEKPVHRMLSREEFLAAFPAGGPPPGAPPTGAPPQPASIKYTPAVCIKNGKYSSADSSMSAVASGAVTDSFADKLKISTQNVGVGGVSVTGIGSEYVIADADIELSGEGQIRATGGLGSGANVENYGLLTIRNSRITMRGVQRNATAAKDYSVLKVYNSTLTAHGAPFVPDRTNTGQKVQMEVDGNARCHVGQGNSYNYFYYSSIIAEGWAALSMDMAAGFAYLEANHCAVKTITAGYGTYSDPGCHNFFNSCAFDVADMAAILSGESDITFNDTTAICGSYFALIHNVSQPKEVSVLRVRGGDVKAKKAAIRVKSGNADIVFDGTQIVSESGVLLESTMSVDPMAARATNTKGMQVYGIHATLKNLEVAGDVVHSADKENRGMTVYLESATLRGAIRDAAISIDRFSRWVATANSNVTLVGNVDVSQIDAPAGVTVTALASQSGSYKLQSAGTLILKTA